MSRCATSSYNNLWNLYGAVDLMGPGQLAATLDGLAPRTMGESGLLLLCALLSLPFLFPVSIPGVSTVFGAGIVLISAAITFNRQPSIAT